MRFMIIYIALLVNIKSTWIGFNKKLFIGYAKMFLTSFKLSVCCSLMIVYAKLQLKTSKKSMELGSSKTICRANKGNANNPEKPKKSSPSSEKKAQSRSINSFGSEVVDVTFLSYPGVYEILDIKNNKSYYGETNLLSRRFMYHHQGLINDTHDCKALILAFREQNKEVENFRFLVHKYGPEWEDKNLRLKYEAELIKNNRHRCYNTELERPTVPRLRKTVMYKGNPYNSARHAARELNLGRTTILRRIASEQYPNVYYIETQTYGFCPIFAKQSKGWSVLFNSMAECVNANYATNIQNARRKIQRNEDGWRYGHFDQNKNPLRVPYSLKKK